MSPPVDPIDSLLAAERDAAALVASLTAEIQAIPARVEEAVEAGDERALIEAEASRAILDRKLEHAVEAARLAKLDRVTAQAAALQATFDADAELAESYAFAAAAYERAAADVRQHRLHPTERRIAALVAERHRLALR